jgi:hypothetical protein
LEIGQRRPHRRIGKTKKKEVEEEEWGVGCRKGGEERAVKMNNGVNSTRAHDPTSDVTLHFFIPELDS